MTEEVCPHGGPVRIKYNKGHANGIICRNCEQEIGFIPMPKLEEPGIHAPERNFRNGKDKVEIRARIVGPVPFEEVLGYLARNDAPQSQDVTLTVGGALMWHEEPTEEDLALKKTRQENANARHEEWERLTLARLKKKYEGEESAAD